MGRGELVMRALSAAVVVSLFLFSLARGAFAEAGQAVPSEPRWSWEEEVEPLDVLEFMDGLPYDQEVEIDELTLRRLFEDIVQRALSMMQIEGDGGDFEATLRRYLLYFTPEVEYYWPPYEEDFSRREVKFPVKVTKKKTWDTGEDFLSFHLGRYADNERDVNVYFHEDGLDIRLFQKKYLPGVDGPPKIEHLLLSISFQYQDAVFGRQYLNDDWLTEYTPPQLLKRWQMGNPSPEIDNTQNEPPLDLTGIGILFDLPYENWRIWGPSLFQTFRSIINLCKLQLNLVDNGYELERYLWRDFFRFDYGTAIFDYWREMANVRRENTYNPDREVFHFDVGNINTARDIYVILSKEFAPPGYDWGIEQITLSRPIIVEGAVGEEVRVLEFGWGVDKTPYALYMLTQSDNEGYTILDRGIAFFRYGEPRNLIGEE